MARVAKTVFLMYLNCHILRCQTKERMRHISKNHIRKHLFKLICIRKNKHRRCFRNNICLNSKCTTTYPVRRSSSNCLYPKLNPKLCVFCTNLIPWWVYLFHLYYNQFNCMSLFMHCNNDHWFTHAAGSKKLLNIRIHNDKENSINFIYLNSLQTQFAYFLRYFHINPPH